MRGVVVRELKLGHQPAGVYRSRSHAIYWDGRNMFGEKVAAGVYFLYTHRRRIHRNPKVIDSEIDMGAIKEFIIL